MVYAWTAVLLSTLHTIGMGLMAILPNILLALLLLILGAIVGSGLARLIKRGVGMVPFDRALESAGITQLVAKSGYTLSIGGIIGFLVEWFIVLTFAIAAFDVLGLDQVNIFLREVVLSYLPHVVVAVLILLAAALTADFVGKTVAGVSRAADVATHHLLGTIARMAIWAFAILAALSELRVAPDFVHILFTGIVVAFSLALGLSFGLGGRDAAARAIEHMEHELKGKK